LSLPKTRSTQQSSSFANIAMVQATDFRQLNYASHLAACGRHLTTPGGAATAQSPHMMGHWRRVASVERMQRCLESNGRDVRRLFREDITAYTPEWPRQRIQRSTIRGATGYANCYSVTAEGCTATLLRARCFRSGVLGLYTACIEYSDSPGLWDCW